MGGQGHCVCEVVCMGGQLGRIPSILSIPDTVSQNTVSGHCVTVSGILCMGGQLGPEYT